MKILFLPKTRLGKYSLWLFITFLILFVTFQIMVATGQRGGVTFFSNLLLSIPIIIAGISGILAFFTGIIGIIRNKERSSLVYFSVFVGFFVLLFILGELIFPH